MLRRGLPRAKTEAERKAISDVQRFGWHCVLVADEYHPHHAAANAELPPHEVYDATFAYTLGLWRTYEHPELILVGRWRHAHEYLNVLAELIGEGQRFTAGDTTTEVLDGYEVAFGAVSEHRRKELLTWADWLNRRRHFEALQVVLPDRSGHWPQDPQYAGFPQPLLA